jgi:hypothetical protein
MLGEIGCLDAAGGMRERAAIDRDVAKGYVFSVTAHSCGG